MFPLVEFPELIQQYAPYFADVFSADAFIEFERYITATFVHKIFIKAHVEMDRHTCTGRQGKISIKRRHWHIGVFVS